MAQQLVDAIFIGSIYAVFAVGYALVFGVLNVLNLAHSAVFMLGAVITYSMVALHGLSFPLALLVGVVASGALGLVIEYVALRPLRRRDAPPMATLISTIALALIFVSIIEQAGPGSWLSWLWRDGANSVRFSPRVIPSATWHVVGLNLDSTRIGIVLISIVLMLVLGYVIRYTQFGRALRAVAENPRAATLVGIRVDRMFVVTLVISSALGGLAGVLFGLALGDISPYIGRDQIEIKGLAVIVLGGMGSIPGAVVGAYLLALIETLAFIGFGSNVAAGVAFLALFVMLVVRPQGLFGSRAVERL